MIKKRTGSTPLLPNQYMNEDFTGDLEKGDNRSDWLIVEAQIEDAIFRCTILFQCHLIHSFVHL